MTPLLFDVISTEYVPALNVYESWVPSASVRLSETTGDSLLPLPPPPQPVTTVLAMSTAHINFMSFPGRIGFSEMMPVIGIEANERYHAEERTRIARNRL
jgi:hypothetical protein